MIALHGGRGGVELTRAYYVGYNTTTSVAQNAAKYVQNKKKHFVFFGFCLFF